MTATISRNPWRKTLQNELMFTAVIRSGIIRYAIAPTTYAAADPVPPNKLVPPTITAATEVRMNSSPAVGEPEAC